MLIVNNILLTRNIR